METLAAFLTRKKAALRAAGPRLALGMAATGLALVRQRIEREGVPGARYSTRLVPTFLFAAKALNAGGRAYVKKNRVGTWQGFKNAQGLSTPGVTLAYSNRMWNSLLPQSTGAGPVSTARLVSTDREGAAKVTHNQRRYGDFLQPNAREVQVLNQYAAAEITKLIQAP